MQLSVTRKKRLAAAGTLVAVSFMVYMLSGSGPVGPPYRDESLTAGPEPFMLVRHPVVRKELKITDAQMKRIDAALQKQSGGRPPAKDAAPAPRMARMGRKHQEAYLALLLQPQQATRLKQITLQLQGGLALNNIQTADALGLTEAQRKKADAVLEKLTHRLNQLRGTRGPDGRKQTEEARAAAGKELLALLTAEQQGRWKELTGDPLEEEITLGPGPGGPGGPPGGPGGGRRPGPPGGGPGGPPQGRQPGPPPGDRAPSTEAAPPPR